MGYDMYLENPSEADAEIRDSYSTEWDRIRGLRDGGEITQEQAMELWANLPQDPTYFRLNIWGMGKCREIMWDRGMLAEPSTHEWPEYPGNEHFNDNDEPITDEGRAYTKTVADVQADENRYGLPGVHKFGSNDGWLVTATE